MRLLSVIFVAATLLSAADPLPKPAAPTRSPKGAAPTGLPKGAVLTAPGTYRYADAKGKTWILRQTPFGIARIEETASQSRPVPPAEPLAGARAEAAGDMIRFERPGPFGVYRWEKNKAELSEMEQAIWDRQLARNSAQ